MTLPYEQVNAMVYTEHFLKDLLDRKKTPRVPLDIRKQAYRLLRHYPARYEVERRWMNGKWR